MDEEVQETSAPKISGVPLETLTKTYIRMRDARYALDKEYQQKIAAIDQDMALIEQEMLELCKSLDANSIKTSAGTVVRSIKSRYWTNDWDSMYRFIAEHQAFPLLERRLHQSHMKQFLEENPDLSPAGLNVEREFTVVVRRAKEN